MIDVIRSSHDQKGGFITKEHTAMHKSFILWQLGVITVLSNIGALPKGSKTAHHCTKISFDVVEKMINTP